MPDRRAAPLTLALSLLCTGLGAFADGAPPATGPGGGSAGTSVPDPVTTFGTNPGAMLGMGVTNMDGDWYVRTMANLDLSFGDVGLGLALPLTLLVSANDQTGCATPPCSRDDKAYFGVLRKHDWDQPSDWFRFFRYIRYGHKRDTVYALVGQHWGSTIGHGTLVNRYNNSLNLNINKVGVAFDVNTTFVGFETLTDNVVSPNLLAARAYVRPFGDTPILRGWAIGATVAADLHAPMSLSMTSTAGGGQTMMVDQYGMPAVAVEDSQLAFGIDTEYELISNKYLRLVPYVDANRLMGGGNGLHLGAMLTVLLPVPLIDVTLDTRLEYRIMQAGYIPEYFDQTYDLGRFNYACNESGCINGYAPKAQAMRYLQKDPNTGNQGYYGELAFNFGGFVQVGGTLQDYQSGSGASLGLYATVPKIEFIKVQGYYLRKNFDGLGDAFALDERSLLGGIIAYRVAGPFYLQGQYQRTWVMDPGKQTVQATDSVSFGVAMLLPFGGGSAGAPPTPPAGN
jgi:hypothetical protein